MCSSPLLEKEHRTQQKQEKEKVCQGLQEQKTITQAFSFEASVQEHGTNIKKRVGSGMSLVLAPLLQA